MAQSFSDDELAAIVAEATRNNLIVAAHCHGPAGIKAALRAGCRTIEHATFLDTDPEALQMMIDADAILVAARSTLEAALRQAVSAGVRIAIGTDLAVSTHRFPCNHGMNGVELHYAIEASLSPLQAIEAATARGPETLGPRAPCSGQLRKDYDADFIALDKNPLEDIDVLADPCNIRDVWKGGLQHKADGKPIGVLETQ